MTPRYEMVRDMLTGYWLVVDRERRTIAVLCHDEAVAVAALARLERQAAAS